MARVTKSEIAALSDDALPPRRRSRVEAAIAASPELARLLAVQERVASTIRAAAAGVAAPERLREALVEVRRADSNPYRPRRS
jgi:anti-sigma factor RsiW